MKRILIIIIVLLFTGCSQKINIFEKSLPISSMNLNDSYYFDESARKELMKQDAEIYKWDADMQEVIDKYNVTFQKVGEPFPEVKVYVADDCLVKTLSEEYNIVYLIEKDGDRNIGKTQVIDREGNVILQALSYEYFDESGKPYKAEFYDSNGNLYHTIEYVNDEIIRKDTESPFHYEYNAEENTIYGYVCFDEDWDEYRLSGDKFLYTIETYDDGRIVRTEHTGAFNSGKPSEEINEIFTYTYIDNNHYKSLYEYYSEDYSYVSESEVKDGFIQTMGEENDLYDVNGYQIYSEVVGENWSFFDLKNMSCIEYRMNDEYTLFELTEYAIKMYSFNYFEVDILERIIPKLSNVQKIETWFKGGLIGPDRNNLKFEYTKTIY